MHCEKVVYPAACVELACPFVYAYEAWGHTYVGCLQKVYEVEIDLDLLRAAERSRGGFGWSAGNRPCRSSAVVSREKSCLPIPPKPLPRLFSPSRSGMVGFGQQG